MFVRNGEKLGSVLVDEASTEPAAPEVIHRSKAEWPEEPGPTMANRKADLVALAVEAGLGDEDELETWTKQELLDELEANEEAE